MASIVTNTADETKDSLIDPKLVPEAERLLSAYRQEIIVAPGPFCLYEMKNYAVGRAMLKADPRLQATLFFLSLPLITRKHDPVLGSIRRKLIGRTLPWNETQLERLLQIGNSSDSEHLLRQVEDYQKRCSTLTPKMTAELHRILAVLNRYSNVSTRKMIPRFMKLLGEGRSVLPQAGEPWADASLAELAALPVAEQTGWRMLFAQAQDCEAAKPSATWRKAARDCIESVGDESFRRSIVRWFHLVTLPPLEPPYVNAAPNYSGSRASDRNITLLKGLAWMCADRTDTETARSLAKLVETGVRKQPGLGPWAIRAVNAAIWALTEMDCTEAVGQLSRLKTKVTYRTALTNIEKGLEIAAKRAGVTKADLEDMSVPAYGFDTHGVRREQFGESAGVATLSPTGEIGIEWFAANGKAVKAPSAEVRKSFAAELKAFKADVDAAGKMLTAQKARFDGFYLPERVWTLKDWQGRFGDHALLSNIAKRLIWHFSDAEHKAQGLWNNQQVGFADAEGAPIDWLTDETEVRLWHPIGFDVEVVLRWREALQKAQIVQPFKQAYREVYLLTEAELQTNAYSNRFAGHILKQHQMNSLAGLRGWQNKLRLMVDDAYPPAMRQLPDLGLRAEFWVEGIGDDYTVDTTDSGSYLYLSTDQVRFYRTGAAVRYAHATGGGYTANPNENVSEADSLPLTEVPALVFSEIMRDVDLFVGVCSIGNDPAWQDGGPQGTHQDYWTDYSFGDLSTTAATRRDVLQNLIPRLKIADRCSLADRFLVVRGDLRTYKIHLGSGNILMEPNDQYLCIVQDRGASRGDAQVGFLPFEGDNRLALILSKAFLLADDTKIQDITIMRQIRPQGMTNRV